MLAKRLLVLLVAMATLFLQVQSCMPLPMASQDMQCCKSMHCAPTNERQACCKNRVSPNAPNMLPTRHISLQAPAVAVVDYPQPLRLARWAFSSPSEPVQAQQHSPPELYTLHASLLI